MRVLFIDPFGDVLALVLRAQKAGHEVVHYIDPGKKWNLVGKGLVKRTGDFKQYIRWADLVVLADNSKHLVHIDRARKEFPGKVFFGANVEGAGLEQDRQIGMKFLEDHGIKCPATKLCASYEQAVAYVKKRDDRLVSKPCGDADKSLSYCSKGPEDMLFMLEKWKKSGKIKDKFILQDFIPGVEFAVGSYMGRNGFAGGWEENFEHKKLMPGEIGTTTGEMGTVLRISAKSKLADKVLDPLEADLVKMGFLGDIDVNCIVDERGTPWPLEFTSRLGFPAVQIQLPLMPDDPVTWMYDLAKYGTEPKFIQEKVSCGVSLCLAPFPYEAGPLELVVDFPVFGLTPYNIKDIHPYHLQKGRDTEWATAGQYAAVVTGQSDTVSGAAENAYRTLSQINIPGDTLYRNDIGKKLSKLLPDLQKHGYAKGWKY